MTNALVPITANPAEIELRPALQNPAIARCDQIRERVFRRVYKQQQSRAVANLDASDAFREAMPPLDSHENIRNFIACVGFAMATGVFLEETGLHLLHAAQVALRAAAQGPKKQNSAASLNSKTEILPSAAFIENN
jgi:hypothetical protein